MITYHPDDYLQNYQNYLLLKQPKYLALPCLKGPAPVTKRSCKIGGQCYIVSLHQQLLPHMVLGMGEYELRLPSSHKWTNCSRFT